MKKTMFTEKIEFKEKVKELRYECNFYKGNIIKSYKTMFDEEEVNKLVYGKTVKDGNLKKRKMNELKDLKSIRKFIICFNIIVSLLGIIVGETELLIIIWLIGGVYWLKYLGDEAHCNVLEKNMTEFEIEYIATGKYLSDRDKDGVYSNMDLEFLDENRLIYEYTYYKVVVSNSNGHLRYFWNKTQEVSLVFLDKLEKIRYFPEGIEVEGVGYFQRFDGSKYYNTPKIFIPNYAENYDEIIEEFEKIAKKYNVEYSLEK